MNRFLERWAEYNDLIRKTSGKDKQLRNRLSELFKVKVDEINEKVLDEEVNILHDLSVISEKRKEAIEEARKEYEQYRKDRASKDRSCFSPRAGENPSSFSF